MAKRNFTRPPVEYRSSDFGKIIDEIYDNINRIDGSVDTLARSSRAIPTSQLLGAKPLIAETECYFDQEDLTVSGDSLPHGVFRFWFRNGIQLMRKVQFRYIRNGLYNPSIAWIDITSGTYNTTPVTGVFDTLPYTAGYIESNTEGRQGGYWKGTVQLPIRKDKFNLDMQVRALGEGDSIIALYTHNFDGDSSPNIISMAAEWDAWDTGTGKYPMKLTVYADEDTASIAYYVTSTVPPDEINEILDSNFTLLVNGRKAIDQSIGTYDPTPIGGSSTKYYVYVRAYSKAGKVTVSGEDPTLTTEFNELITPLDPRDPAVLNPLSITASQLVQSAQTVRPDFDVTVNDNNTITVGGSLTYGDSTTYSLSGTAVTLPNNNLWYAFFDPFEWHQVGTVNVDYIDYGSNSATQQIQYTSDEALAKGYPTDDPNDNLTGRRRFVGVVQATSDVNEYAFAVFTSAKPIISAPLIQVVKLSALTADVGVLTAGILRSNTWVTSGGTQGWEFDMDGGTIKLGGSSLPLFSWDDGTGTLLISNFQHSVHYDTSLNAPTSPTEGDLWFYTDELKMVRYNGTTWDDVATEDIAWRHASDSTKIDGGEVYVGSKLTVGTGTDVAVVDGADATYRFYAGHTTPASAPVRIQKNGAFHFGDAGSHHVSWSPGTLSVNGSMTVTGSISVGSSITIANELFGAGLEGIKMNDGVQDRIHIGQTAVGIYTVKIFDESGNTVFDATEGVTPVLKNANLETLTISGVLTIGAAGQISLDSGNFILDQNELNIGSGDIVIGRTTGVDFDLKTSSLQAVSVISWNGAGYGSVDLNGYSNAGDTSTRGLLRSVDLTSGHLGTLILQATGAGTDSAIISLTGGATANNTIIDLDADEIFLNLPTSAGATGSLWNDSGTVKVA